jgi:hypothetical protein
MHGLAWIKKMRPRFPITCRICSGQGIETIPHSSCELVCAQSDAGTVRTAGRTHPPSRPSPSWTAGAPRFGPTSPTYGLDSAKFARFNPPGQTRSNHKKEPVLKTPAHFKPQKPTVLIPVTEAFVPVKYRLNTGNVPVALRCLFVNGPYPCHERPIPFAERAVSRTRTNPQPSASISKSGASILESTNCKPLCA